MGMNPGSSESKFAVHETDKQSFSSQGQPAHSITQKQDFKTKFFNLSNLQDDSPTATAIAIKTCSIFFLRYAELNSFLEHSDL